MTLITIPMKQIALCLATFVLASCQGYGLLQRNPVSKPAEQLQPTQSWDQANLKANDHGCPSAVYVAPNGELKQC